MKSKWAVDLDCPFTGPFRMALPAASRTDSRAHLPKAPTPLSFTTKVPVFALRERREIMKPKNLTSPRFLCLWWVPSRQCPALPHAGDGAGARVAGRADHRSVMAQGHRSVWAIAGHGSSKRRRRTTVGARRSHRGARAR